MVLVEKDSLYRRTEGLLREYRAMKARVEILEKELGKLGGNGIFDNKDEAILGYYFSRTISDMPHGTELSDKTANVALNYQEQYREEFHKVWKQYVHEKENMKYELDTVKRMLQIMDIALNSLLLEQKLIITMFYVEGKKWLEISNTTQYAIRHCKRIRDQGVWYMAKSMTAGKWKVY